MTHQCRGEFAPELRQCDEAGDRDESVTFGLAPIPLTASAAAINAFEDTVTSLSLGVKSPKRQRQCLRARRRAYGTPGLALAWPGLPRTLLNVFAERKRAWRRVLTDRSQLAAQSWIRRVDPA